jgi:hypothetical protein
MSFQNARLGAWIIPKEAFDETKKQLAEGGIIRISGDYYDMKGNYVHHGLYINAKYTNDPQNKSLFCFWVTNNERRRIIRTLNAMGS